MYYFGTIKEKSEKGNVLSPLTPQVLRFFRMASNINKSVTATYVLITKTKRSLAVNGICN